MCNLELETPIVPACVPPSEIFTSPPSASRVISPATSNVKSPLDKSISVPSMVMLPTVIPASASTTPLNVPVVVSMAVAIISAGFFPT